MSRHEARGTKRICQNQECILPFYDLNRLDYACPNCGAAYDAGAAAQAVAVAPSRLRIQPAARPVDLPRGPARPLVDEPEQVAAGIDETDDETEEADAEGDADNLLDLDDDDDDVEPLPEKAADD